MDEVITILSDIYQSGGFWLVIALLAALILMQGVKAVIKEFWHPKNLHFRTWVIFIIAYVVGFQCGNYFLEGNDSHKWAVFIGLSNPIVYILLVRYATVKKHIILLSALKMRPIVEVDGQWKLHETQTFFIKQ